MHKRTKNKHTPTNKTGFSRAKAGCRDSLLVTGIILLKAGWLVDAANMEISTGIPRSLARAVGASEGVTESKNGVTL